MQVERTTPIPRTTPPEGEEDVPNQVAKETMMGTNELEANVPPELVLMGDAPVLTEEVEEATMETTMGMTTTRDPPAMEAREEAIPMVREAVTRMDPAKEEPMEPEAREELPTPTGQWSTPSTVSSLNSLLPMPPRLNLW